VAIVNRSGYPDDRPRPGGFAYDVEASDALDASVPVNRRPVMMALVGWSALWASLNSGQWYLLSFPESTLDWIHFARTALPLLIFTLLLPQALGVLLRGGSATTLTCWTAYGAIASAASFQSPDLLNGLFWAAYYLAGITVIAMVGNRGGRFVLAAVTRGGWLIATAYVVFLLIVARDVLIEQATVAGTGYGIIGAMPTVAGVAMSRSSGMARLLAVPGLVTLVAAVYANGMRRYALGLLAFVFAALLFFFQSRGAMMGYVGAIVVVGYVVLARANRSTVTLVFSSLLMIAGLLVLSEVPAARHMVENSLEWFRRGASNEQLYEMTGRTRDWGRALPLVAESPVWGWGMQSDRSLMEGTHVHNTYLYAALAAGLPGLAFFTLGLIAAWRSLFRLIRRVPSDEQVFLAQCAALLAFFTVRGIPEVSGPMFGVDYLVMLPIVAYLGAAERELITTSASTET